MLTNPRMYSWDPQNRSGPPFVQGESLRSDWGLPRYLIAGDGHRIPFPHRVLDSDAFRRRIGSRCTTRLFVQTDGNPYAGVDYVMEIRLARTPAGNVLYEVARTSFRALRPLRQAMTGGGLLPLSTPAAAGVGVAAGILLAPSPLGDEHYWTERAHLSHGTVVVRYEYFP